MSTEGRESKGGVEPQIGPHCMCAWKQWWLPDANFIYWLWKPYACTWCTCQQVIAKQMLDTTVWNGSYTTRHISTIPWVFHVPFHRLIAYGKMRLYLIYSIASNGRNTTTSTASSHSMTFHSQQLRLWRPYWHWPSQYRHLPGLLQLPAFGCWSTWPNKPRAHDRHNKLCFVKSSSWRIVNHLSEFYLYC